MRNSALKDVYITRFYEGFGYGKVYKTKLILQEVSKLLDSYYRIFRILNTRIDFHVCLSISRK
jgi:hypothetical protein